MSYQSWHEYGIGFNFSVFEAECEKIGDPITVEDVERLLACNPTLERDVHEWLDEIKEDNLREKEDIPHVYAICDYNNDHYVIFGQGYPWNMSEKEKRLNQDELEKIFRTYLTILKPATGEKLCVDIDNQSIENGG